MRGDSWIETQEREKERRKGVDGGHFIRKPEAGSRRDLKTRACTEIVRGSKFARRESDFGAIRSRGSCVSC